MNGLLNTLNFLLIFGVLQNVSADLTLLSPNPNEYQVLYNDVLFFHHTSTSPVVKLGRGSANFTENLGNFDIQESIEEEVELLSVSVLQNSSQNIELLFQSDPSLQVILSINETQAPDGENRVTFSAAAHSLNPEDWNRLWLRVSAETDERVYGAGEQFTYFNLRGHSFPIWTREQGVGRNDSLISNFTDWLEEGAGGEYHTTYYPQASFLSSRKYYLQLYNRQYLIMNFENEATHELYGPTTTLNGLFLFSNSINSLVPRIANYIGLQPMLPDWIMTGAMLGVQLGTDNMLMRYEEAKSFGVNISSLWIQDWSGTTQTSFGHRVYWQWKWNETYYPGLDTVIQDLLNENVRVAVYCNPHLIEGSELFQAAEAGNHFLTDSEGNTFLQDFGEFMAGTIDVIDDTSRAWYADQLKNNILGLGIGAWMADFGEYTHLDMKTKAPGVSSQEMHNILPVKWAQTNREFVEEAGSLGDVVYFMRAGGLDSSSHQVLAWAGDQNVDFSLSDGIATTVVAALSLSVSGMGLSHFDIGGYTTQAPALQRSEELFLRSAEYSVFTPVMRTHEGNKPSQNWQFYSTNETLQSFARLTQIHAMLLPYTKYVVGENADKGIPVQRPMFFHYENDDESWDQMYQYMFGPDLIVAPVIHKGQMDVTVYIPGGDNAEWYQFWGGIGPHYGPKNLTLNCQMGFPAVLYRRSSVYADLFQQIDSIYGNN